jgi:hypothetical protein
MISNFAYPLGCEDGQYFVGYPDTSFESYMRALKAGTFTNPYLATCFRQIKLGDRLWFLYGQSHGDHGFVGVGNVTTDPYIRHSDGQWSVKFDMDLDATWKLLRNGPSGDEIRRMGLDRVQSVRPIDKPKYDILRRRILLASGLATLRRRRSA